jgi:3-hydroxyisobutyrate dehydrogenase-like beta-hydroxyacid dehydrogenase
MRPIGGESAMNVGFIGLGNMGKRMALNLVKSGLDVVVLSRSQGPIVKAGACQVESLVEVATFCDVVCTCLPEVSTSEHVYLSSDGLVASGRPGQVLMEHSTISPSLARRVGAAAVARGVGYLDAPISGGVSGATDGTLTIMASGDIESFKKAKSVLEGMGKNIHHVGPVGQGTMFKLVNQLLTSVHTLAACEALLLGKRAGVDLNQLVDVLETSWGASTLLLRHAPLIISGDYGTQAPTRLLVKDMGLIQEVADELGVPLPLGERTRTLLDEALQQGLGEVDVASLITVLEASA